MNKTEGDIVVLEPSAQAPPPHPLTIVAEMVKAGASADAIATMSKVAAEWADRDAKEKYALALNEFRRRCPVITKHKDAVKFKYAPFEYIISIAGPIMAELGIVDSYHMVPGGDAETFFMVCRLRVGSYSEDHAIPSKLVTKANLPLNEAQLAAQTHSILKRYALCGALRITLQGEDDEKALMDQEITPVEVEEIESLIARCKETGNPINEKAFRSYVKFDGNLSNLTQRQYRLAVSALKDKIAANLAAKENK